jgi:hypothetical protein
VEEEGEEVPVRLSPMARWWRRTAARRSDDLVTRKEEEDANEVRHGLGQLFEEQGVALFTTSGEKAKMRPTRCDSGDEVGRGSTGELARFH